MNTTTTPPDDGVTVLETLKKQLWWQGSVIPASHLAEIGQSDDRAAYWILASQTCSILNPHFDRVSVVELVGAERLEQYSSMQARGADPRVLHVLATNDTGQELALAVNIQVRKWLTRVDLVKLPAPSFAVKDPPRSEWKAKITWLDNLAGWLGRSYTRVALPDAFNMALRQSKLEKVLNEKVPKDRDNRDSLYGIYLSVEHDSDTAWEDFLGLMPPPYNLAITLVVNESLPRVSLRKRLVDQIFNDPVQDPSDPSKSTTRAKLASQHQLRIIESGVEVRGMSDITLAELRDLIRYTMVDHLSSSSCVGDE